MTRAGTKLTLEQRECLSKSHLGQVAWNRGAGGCKRGHDPALYVPMPSSGVFVCLGCKRENGAKYRQENQPAINLKNRVGRYSISIEQYEGLMATQANKCAICLDAIDLKTARIDHDHATGTVRGLLCVACNTALGLLKDSPDVLIMAAAYLERAR